MSKTIRRQRSVMADEDREEEEKNDELEQQMQKKLAAQRVAAIGKRPRGLAADTPVDDNSEDEEEEDEFRDEYTYSVQDDPGLYKDVHDYSQLQALSEFDREMEIAERMDMRQRNVDQWDRRREILGEKRKQKRQAAEAASKKQRAASRAPRTIAEPEAADEEMPGSAKPPDARQQLLAEMQAEREKRSAQMQAKEGAKGKRPGRRADTDDDDDFEEEAAGETQTAELEEGEEEEDEDFSAGSGRRERTGRTRLADDDEDGGDADDAPAEYAQLERIRLTRARLEAWVEEPFFEDVAVGCFVRIGIGSDSGDRIYRVAEVVGVTVGSAPYALGGKATRKRLTLEIAGSRRAFQMSFVSNSNFAQDELRKYRKLLEERVLPRQTQRMVDKKVSQLVKAKQYIYNEHDIAKMVDKNLQDKVVVGSNAIRRAELAELREAALEKKDETELNKFDGLLGELDERAVETRRAMETSQMPATSVNSGIMAINDRNRKLQRAGDETFKVNAQTAEDELNNPFARRETRPSMYWHVSAPAKKAEPEKPAALAIDPDAAGGNFLKSPTTPTFAKLMRQSNSGDFDEPDGGGGAALFGGDDATSELVAAHMIRLDLEVIDSKSVLPRAPSTQTGDYSALFNTKLYVTHATKRMSLLDYVNRRDGVAS